MNRDHQATHGLNKKLRKICFVTIGATASFDRLLRAVLERSFLEALHHADYTGLIVQYGKEGGKAIYEGFLARDGGKVQEKLGIEITGFDFKVNGIEQDMHIAKGIPGNGSDGGLVISHAGR